MNKAAIKKELRRSACEDKYPLSSLNDEAWECMMDEGFRARFFDHFLDDNHVRIFFLLVAEAL